MSGAITHGKIVAENDKIFNNRVDFFCTMVLEGKEEINIKMRY